MDDLHACQTSTESLQRRLRRLSNGRRVRLSEIGVEGEGEFTICRTTHCVQWTTCMLWRPAPKEGNGDAAVSATARDCGWRRLGSRGEGELTTCTRTHCVQWTTCMLWRPAPKGENGDATDSTTAHDASLGRLDKGLSCLTRDDCAFDEMGGRKAKGSKG